MKNKGIGLRLLFAIFIHALLLTGYSVEAQSVNETIRRYQAARTATLSEAMNWNAPVSASYFIRFPESFPAAAPDGRGAGLLLWQPPKG
jgi:hypothetical protein